MTEPEGKPDEATLELLYVAEVPECPKCEGERHHVRHIAICLTRDAANPVELVSKCLRCNAVLKMPMERTRPKRVDTVPKQ